MEPEVRRPGRVHDEWTAVGVGDLGEPSDVTDCPQVGWVADQHGSRAQLLDRGPRVSGATPRVSRLSWSTSGRTHTGVSPARTRPSNMKAGSAQPSTSSPPSATASASAWFAWVAPPIENRHIGTPQAGGAVLGVGQYPRDELHRV